MISKKVFDSTEEDMNFASIQGKRFFHEFNRRDVPAKKIGNAEK